MNMLQVISLTSFDYRLFGRDCRLEYYIILYTCHESCQSLFVFSLQDKKYKEIKQRYEELYARLSHIKKLVVEYDQSNVQPIS